MISQSGAKRTYSVTLYVLGAVLTILWLVGLRFYMSFGVDRDVPDGAGVWHHYYRIQWQGDGSFRIGGSGYRVEPPDRPLEAFDPGGTARRKESTREALWNGMYRCSWASSFHASAWAAWLTVPGWLPALLCAGAAAWLGRRRGKPTTTISECKG
jgi:hypothetical protein